MAVTIKVIFAETTDKLARNIERFGAKKTTMDIREHIKFDI